MRLRGGQRGKVATVQHIYRDIEGGVRLDAPLGTFYSWNEADLVRVE